MNLPTMKKRHFSGGETPENYVCVRRPQSAVYDIGIFGENHHRHAGGLYGFWDCEGELVKRWPKTPRQSLNEAQEVKLE
jgi:hypothetical protein